MKKFLLIAVAAFGMLMTACSKDEVAQPVGGEESVVTFTVEAPVMATRAYGEGLVATELNWAVYDKDHNYLFGGKDIDGYKKTLVDKQAIVEIPFVNGMAYNILFWAEAPDTADTESPYVVDWDAKTVSYADGTKLANDENFDAFFCYYPVPVVTGPVNEDVELKRPFAQLNIATNDTADAALSKIVVTDTKVTVANTYTEFYFVDGDVTGNTSTVEFAYNNDVKKAVGQIEVGGKAYDLLSVNYLFGFKDDKKLIDATLTYKYGNDTVVTAEYNSVPIQQNYRTNIIGSLLTSEGKFNIDIEEGFADEEHNVVSSAAALEELLNQGGSVTLDADYVLDRPVVIAEGKTVVLDMNGKTLKGTMHKSVGAVLKNMGTLTVKNGTISSTAKNGGSAIQNNAGAELTINDVTINGAEFEAPGWPSYGINNYGTLTINDADITTYHGAVATGGDGVTVINDATVDVGNSTETNQTSWALYVYENGQLTVNGGTFANTKNENGQVFGGGYICTSSTNQTIINGGTFDKTEGDNNGTGFYYNNKNLVIKGGTFDADPSAYVANGYKAVENGNSNWSVVSYASILEEQINQGGEVTIDKDMLIVEPIVVAEGVVATLNLNNMTLEGTMPKSVGAVLKNEGTLTVKGGVIKSTGANGGSAIQNNGTLTVEDATVIGSSIRENEGWPSYPINNYGDITIKNTSITGYQGAIACNAAGTTTVENCVVNKEYLNTSSHTFYINHADANVIVNGGTYTHNGMDGSLAYVNAGSITINDGVFTASNGGYGIAPLTNGKVIINGGTFNNAFLGWGGAISIYGGILKSQPKAEWVADGLKAIKSGDNYVVVAEGVNGVASTPIAPGSEDGETYTGELFENPITNALYYNNWILNDDATITIGENNFGAIILENVEGNLNGNVIEVNNTNNPVMVLQNCNFTLNEGKKLIKSTNTIYQVFMANITINGVKLTNENAGQYLENVGWFQVVEEI